MLMPLRAQCDGGLPRCSPCTQSDSTCEQADVRRQQALPRGHVEELESRLDAAEGENA